MTTDADLSAEPARAPSKPELLAPAGDWDCLRAAVENGADAVYFGLKTGFNARARAANFDPGELPEVMAYLHRRGVRGYVTLNTLIFPGELAELEATTRMLAAAGVDAALVQDLGALGLIRAICPDLAIHASTQMTLSSAESISLAGALGVERVVLARELSIDEIGRIRRETNMPLEVFVHGALCVAYSGQCLTSESLGGRSANRGQCAQACRLPYELVCDGKDVDLGPQRYLLSPQDLAAYDLTPDLVAAGVAAFKIEGRLKSAEYVANITRHYRRAIDAAIAGRPAVFTPRDVETMELSFSRGFSHGWLDGPDHKALVPAVSSAKHGVLVGRVVGLARRRVAVELCGSLQRGDGVVFSADRAAGREQGGRIYEIFQRGRSLEDRVAEGIVELAFAHGAVDASSLTVGQEIWKTDEPHLVAELRKSFTSPRARRAIPLELTVRAAVGEPLVIEAAAGGIPLRLVSAEPLAAASRHPASEAMLGEQLGRLGATSYRLERLRADIIGGPMIPLSVLGKLRRELVERLDAALAGAERPCAVEMSLDAVRKEMFAAARSRRDAATPRDASDRELVADDADGANSPAPTLHVLCRTLNQLKAALAARLRRVMVDFQDIRQYADAVELAHAAGAEILLATPRIQKPGEIGVFRAIERQGADGVLARNLAGLDYFVRAGVMTAADFSLNAANELTVAELIRLGAGWVTASYDLNREQLLDLVAATPAEWLEIVLHQHMPMFHMEHCVFCAVLSPGTNKTNCGRPCDEHVVKLRDRTGMEHPLAADIGCRNTLYNATPQSAAEAAPALIASGAMRFRVELLGQDSPEEVVQVVDLYRDLIAGVRSGREVWRRLKAANRVGVTRGALEERRDPLAIL